jgi:hypothetical protein
MGYFLSSTISRKNSEFTARVIDAHRVSGSRAFFRDQ